MAEQEYVVVYAAAYPTVAAARAVLDTIEHLPKDEVIGDYDAAVIDKENGKPHVVERWTTRTPASSPSGSAAGL